MAESKEIRYVHMERLVPLMQEALAAGQSVRFSPRGVSMLPMLRQGVDSVVLSPISGPLRKYDIPLYRRDNGSYVLHRVVRVGETYTCVGDNQFALERGLRHDQMLGVVTAFYRGERLVKTDDPGYRLYCRAWHHTRLLRRAWRGVKSRLRRIIR